MSKNIEKSTLTFLKNLGKNNNREWFNANKKEFEKSKQNFLEVFDQIIDGVAHFDQKVENEKDQIKIFRIYRDVRFSKDKTPYKTNLGGAIYPGGKKAPYAGYYVHIQPGESGLAGGKYELDSKQLLAIREYIAEHYKELETLLNSASFKKLFPEGFGTENKLKRVPRGFDKDHPAADLLKHKWFTVWHTVSDTEVLSKDFVSHATNVFKEMKTLHDFLNKALR